MRCSVLSESAKAHELCYLKRFDSYVGNSITSPECLTEDFMNGWIRQLSGKSSSIENEVIVVRQFLKYLELSGEKIYIPIIPKVREDYVPYIFSDEELKSIFNSSDNIFPINSQTDRYLAIEFPIILRLLYSCGLRIGETVKLKMSDIDLEHGILTLVKTKGNKQRLVPMSCEMTDILAKYCLVMGLSDKSNAWLFPSSKKDGHIPDKTIKRRFEMILKENKIYLPNRMKHERGPCLHCMRHVFAFKSFAKAEREGRHLNDSIPYLSLYLGHERLNETAKYLKFSNESFPESIDVFGEFMSGLLPEVQDEA